MNCVVCGRISSKPICEICSKRITIDYPFIIHHGLLIGDFEGMSEEHLFKNDLEKLNEEAKKVIMGDGGDRLKLAKTALIFHKKYHFLLDSMEIDEKYYLHLAREFVRDEDSPEAKFLLAKIYIEMEEYEEAEHILEDIWRDKREYAILYGKTLVNVGKWGRAIEVYNHILGENKEDSEIWKLLADALYVAEKYEEAERAYLKVLQMNKDDYEAWYRRGLCLKKLGKWGGALQSFQTAVRKNPKYREAYEGMLDILIEREMYTRAIEVLKRMKEEGFEVEERIRELEGR